MQKDPTDNVTGHVCSKRRRCPGGTANEFVCDQGYYSDVEGLSECKACVAGFYCAPDADPVECPQGNDWILVKISIYTEQQKKRRMNTKYQHGRLHTKCFENHSSHIPSPCRIIRHSHDSE